MRNNETHIAFVKKKLSFYKTIGWGVIMGYAVIIPHDIIFGSIMFY